MELMIDMEYITISAEALESLYYLRKHLFDDPSINPTNVPKITPNGKEVTSIKQIAGILGVDKKIAAVYVLQDPSANNELKAEAIEETTPGIYLAIEDGYAPVIHKAYDIYTNKFDGINKKSIRMVRTVNGVRRFRQKRGSIIVDDNEPPLDALVALTNDVAGFEKVADKNGQVYYVGNRGGKWVVINPLENSIIHSTADEKESFRWLNSHVGGSGVEKDKPGAAKKPAQSAPDSGSSLSAEESTQVSKMTNEQADLYRKLKTRGLTHQQAIAIVFRSLPSRKK